MLGQNCCIKNIEFLDVPIIRPNISEYVYKIIYVLNGDLKISFPTRQLNAGPRDLILFNNYEPHHITVQSPVFTRYFATLSPKYTDFVIKDPHLLSIFKNPLTFNNIFHIPEEDPLPESIFRQLLLEKASGDPYTDRMSENSIYTLLVYLFRNYITHLSMAEDTIFFRVCQIQQYIDDHFTEKIQISDLAKMHYISESYLSHSFQRVTGYSPKQYQQMLRLSYAKALLSSNISVTSASEQVGFSDVNNFIKAFKRQYNITPGLFRKGIAEISKINTHKDTSKPIPI